MSVHTRIVRKKASYEEYEQNTNNSKKSLDYNIVVVGYLRVHCEQSGYPKGARSSAVVEAICYNL